MAAPKVVHGARAKIAWVDPQTGKAQVIGIFNSVSYSVQYGAQAIYILGRYTPAELAYTHAEPVQLTLTAWRVVGHGPYVDGKVPRVQDLLRHEYVECSVIDRVAEGDNGDGRIAKIRSIRPTGWSETIANRQVSEIQIQAIGILIDDESVDNAEVAGSTQLP